MFYKIGNSRVVHNGSVFVFVLFVLWQFVVGITAICCGNFCNPLAAVGDRFIVPAYTYLPRIRNPLGHISQSVGTHLAIRQQHYRNPSAAVGADLSCPRIRIHPRNGERMHVCDEMDMCI